MARFHFSPASLFQVGSRRSPSGLLGVLVGVWAFGVALYTVLAASWWILPTWQLTATFLAASMVVAFLMVGASPDADPKKPAVIDWVLSAVSLVLLAYFLLNRDEITTRIALFNELTAIETAVAAATVALTLELTRRSTGMGLTLIVIIFMIYNLFGHLLGGAAGHGYISPYHFLDLIVFTTDGIMGLPLMVAATYAFLFVLFGTILHHTRGGDFFFDLASAMTGSRPGGPAKVAVVSSGLYGTISGSPTSDVVTTGSITIPIMKRLGMSASVAGGIEVAASTGGSILPPVMGSAAFLMAEYTGFEYREIAIAAILPALLYYVAVYAQVHFHALNTGMKGFAKEDIPQISAVLKRGWIFLVPLVVISWALLTGYTPTYAALYGIGSLLAVSVLRKDSRIGPLGLARVMAETTVRVLPVAGACAAAGLVIAGITMTGLAPKFTLVVQALVADSIFGTLLICAIMTIILGMGMPTPSAYILAAVMVGPLMAKLGIPLMAAHMFLLYFACMSALTPPVAVAAYAAAPIADANPMSIAVAATRFAIAAFVVPFTFVFGQGLLMIGEPERILLDSVTAFFGVIMLAAAVEGWKKLGRTKPGRILLAIGAVFLIAPVTWGIAAGFGLAVLAWLADRLAGGPVVKTAE